MRLEDCYHGFREGYLDYLGAQWQLRTMAEAFPGLVQLSSPGRAPEEREVWLLTVEPEFERVRPPV